MGRFKSLVSHTQNMSPLGKLTNNERDKNQQG